MIVQQALEIRGPAGEHTGKWHYTLSFGEGAVCPTGYCAQNCPGHPSEEEACDHYRLYLLDYHSRYDGTWEETQQRCKVCSEWTNRFAFVADGPFETVIPLCDAHCSREHVEALCPTLAALSHFH